MSGLAQHGCVETTDYTIEMGGNDQRLTPEFEFTAAYAGEYPEQP